MSDIVPEVTPFFTFTMNLVYPFLVGALLVYLRNTNEKNNKIATRREDAHLKYKQDSQDKVSNLDTKLYNLEIRNNDKVTRAEANDLFVTIKMFDYHAETINKRFEHSDKLMETGFRETREDIRELIKYIKKD